MPTEMIRIETLNSNERRLLRSISPDERKSILVAAAIQKLQQEGDVMMHAAYEDELEMSQQSRPITVGTLSRQPLPAIAKDTLDSRLEDLARELRGAEFTEDQMLQVCLSQANKILDELSAVHQIYPTRWEKEVARALIKAKEAYHER